MTRLGRFLVKSATTKCNSDQAPDPTPGCSSLVGPKLTNQQRKKEHKMKYLIRPILVVLLLIGVTTTGNTQQRWDRASAGPDYNLPGKLNNVAAAAPVKVRVEQSQVRLVRNGKTIAICRTQLFEIENWK